MHGPICISRTNLTPFSFRYKTLVSAALSGDTAADRAAAEAKLQHLYREGPLDSVDQWAQLSGSDASAALVALGGGPSGGPRVWSHCRFVKPRIQFIPDSLIYSVPLFLKQQCDRTLGEPRTEIVLAGIDSDKKGAAIRVGDYKLLIGSDWGADRARSHCRFVPPLISIPYQVHKHIRCLCS